MRWKIKSINTTTSGDKTTTKVTKAFVITVGDIAGTARTAAGALKSLAANFPKWFASMNQPGSALPVAQAATAVALNSLIQPMAAIVQGMEVYRIIMKVMSIVSPILQMVARATGVWNSPGNAADMGDIIAGGINELLSGIAVSAFLMLKEWIWNYEFEIWETTDEYIKEICKALTLYTDRINNNIKSGIKLVNSDPEGIALSPSITGNPKYTGKGDLGTTSEYNLKPDGSLATYNKKSYYKTIYKIKDKQYPRILRGSDNDGGIQYSDDDGVSWKNTKQLSGSFCCFGKIVTEDEKNYTIRYFAASAPYVKKVIQTKDEAIHEMDSNIQTGKKYDKLYYGSNIKELNSKAKKAAQSNFPQGFYEPDTETKKEGTEELLNYIPASGLWYSDDDGITWQQLESMKTGYYSGFYEFSKKLPEDSDGDIIPFTLVVATNGIPTSGNDLYKGIFYTTDGNTWTQSQVVTEDETKVNSEAKWPSISIIDASFIIRPYPRNVEVSCDLTANIWIRRDCNFDSFIVKSDIIAIDEAEENNGN